MKHSGYLVALGLVGLLGVVGCTRVSPGTVGIKVVNGGSDRGVSDYPTQVGWVVYNPITTTVFEYPTFVQTVVWTKDAAEGHPANEEITFTNKDKMVISVDVNLAYHLDATKVPAFYVKFRHDDLNTFTHSFLRSEARDAFNKHAGVYSIDQIMGDNADFIDKVKEALAARVEPYGVLIDQFGVIGAPRPPPSVSDQITASVHAAQLTTQKQAELMQVQADMAKEREKTDTYARNTLTLAEAQALANRKLSESLTPNLIDLKRLEKWNGVLPQVSGGNGVPFINISPKQ